MQALLPRPAQLSSATWWAQFAGIALTAFVATLLSFSIALTDLAISPMLLVPGVAMALLWRFGLALWPAVALGDFAGQWFVHERPMYLLVASMIVHVGIGLAGAAWARRLDCRPRDLASVVRFAGMALALSTVAAAVIEVLLELAGEPDAAGSDLLTFAWELLGYSAGFLVAGALLMAWLGPWQEVRDQVLRPVAMTGVVAVALAAALGFRWGVAAAVAIALLGALAVSARSGTVWGTTAMGWIALFAIWGARDGRAPFGGANGTEQAVNVMLAVALFALAGLMVAGYHRAGDGRRYPAPVVATTFAVLMLIAGVASLAANEVALDVDEPFVLSGLVALGAGLGLALLRLARTPERPSSVRGIVIAAAAGAVYVLNLVVYLAAVPLIGSGPATALSMTAPLAVVLLSLAIYRTRPSAGVIAAVGLIVIGAVIVAGGAIGEPAGVALALASAAIFAVSLLITQGALRHANVVDVALASALSAAVVALAIGLVVEGPSAFALSPQEVGELALAALGAQLVPMLGRSWALDQISADLVGAEGVLAPVVTALMSILFIDSVVSGGEVVGLVVITAGALVATLAGSRGRRTASPVPSPAPEAPG